jgi:hypothetical protein
MVDMIKEKRIDLKAMTFDDAVKYYQDELGYSEEEAKRLVRIARGDGKSEVTYKKNERTLTRTS